MKKIKWRNRHNLSKSTKSGRHDTLLLKHSWWGIKPCGGRNKNVAHMQHLRDVPSWIRWLEVLVGNGSITVCILVRNIYSVKNKKGTDEENQMTQKMCKNFLFIGNVLQSVKPSTFVLVSAFGFDVPINFSHYDKSCFRCCSSLRIFWVVTKMFVPMRNEGPSVTFLSSFGHFQPPSECVDWSAVFVGCLSLAVGLQSKFPPVGL